MLRRCSVHTRQSRPWGSTEGRVMWWWGEECNRAEARTCHGEPGPVADPDTGYV